MGTKLTENGKQGFAELDKQIRECVGTIETSSLVLARSLRLMAQESSDGTPFWKLGGFASYKCYLEDVHIEAGRYRLLRNAGEVVHLIESQYRENQHDHVRPVTENQIRALGSIAANDPDSVFPLWEMAIEAALEDGGDSPERRHVELVVNEYKARGGNLNGRRRYSQRERELKAECENGHTVIANITTDSALISWAEEKGVYVYVGRGSKWGNPFKLPDDGDRNQVCKCYEKHYLPHKPSLLNDGASLIGKVLGCYCAPEKCHAESLVDLANKSSEA